MDMTGTASGIGMQSSVNFAIGGRSGTSVYTQQAAANPVHAPLEREQSVGMEFARKSWFTALIGGHDADHHIVMIKDRPLSKIKADLLQAFLWVRSLFIHGFLCSQNEHF